MKDQNFASKFSKGLICAVVIAFFAISVQAKPFDITLKSDTGKMAKKMDDKMKMENKKKMEDKKKMDDKMKMEKKKMKKDTTSKM